MEKSSDSVARISELELGFDNHKLACLSKLLTLPKPGFPLPSNQDDKSCFSYSFSKHLLGT